MNQEEEQSNIVDIPIDDTPTPTPISGTGTDTDSETVSEVINQPTYYVILNIPLDATEKIIFESYKQLSVMYHPDRCM